MHREAVDCDWKRKLEAKLVDSAVHGIDRPEQTACKGHACEKEKGTTVEVGEEVRGNRDDG